MAKIENVTGEVLLQNYELQKKFNEFQRQINQKNGYPFDFIALMVHLQSGVDGFFIGVKNFSSKLFKKTSTVVITKNPESFMINENSVMALFEPVIKKEEELGNPTPYIDTDLWDYFNGQTVSGILSDFTSVIYRFIVNLTHKRILDEAKNTEIKKIYTYLEGLSIICQVILNGEVDKKDTGIIVYFEVDGMDSLYRFHAYRYDGIKLKVYVHEINFNNEWVAADGACFRN